MFTTNSDISSDFCNPILFGTNSPITSDKYDNISVTIITDISLACGIFPSTFSNVFDRLNAADADAKS